MRILNVKQFKELLEKNPDNRYAFIEYKPGVTVSELMVSDEGAFGATYVIPWPGEVFDFDFNVEEYRDDDDSYFMVFDNNDIARMIQTLSSAFNNIELADDWV